MPSEFIEQANANPIDRADFVQLARIAIDAHEGRRREIPPNAERCFEDFPPGSVHLTDVPMNHFGLAIVRECNARFGKSRGKTISSSFIFRWFALIEAVNSGRTNMHRRPCADGTGEEFHEAVFAAAAECPLVAWDRFDDTFELRASRIRSEMDS